MTGMSAGSTTDSQLWEISSSRWGNGLPSSGQTFGGPTWSGLCSRFRIYSALNFEKIRGEVLHAGAGGSAAFSAGVAALSALLTIAQNRPLAPGGTDPELCRAGYRVPAPDPAFP